METLLAVVVAGFFAAAVYLLLSRHVVRVMLGVVILGNAVNLTIFTAGRLVTANPPLIGASETALEPGSANPLPQALVLTAIVISFSLFAFLLVLGMRAYQELSTDDMNDMNLAEPREPARPALDY